MSLKLRLTLLSTLLMALTLTLVGLASYHYVADALSRQLDAALEDRAAEVIDDIAQIGPRFYNGQAVKIGETSRPETVPVNIEIVDRQGVVLYRSARLGGRLLPLDHTALRQALKGGITTQDKPNSAGVMLHVRYVPLANAGKSISSVLLVSTPMTATASALGLMRLLLIGTTLMSSALLGLGVWLTLNRALGAVDRVSRTAATIEVSPNLDQRIPEDSAAGDDEMARLVRTFNGMLGRLSAAFSAQQQFVADSSHELRSPLTVIRGNLDLLRRTTDPAERGAIVRLIEDEAARMSRLVDNLLFLAQLEESPGPGHLLDCRPVELDSLLLRVYQQARSMTSRHTIQLGEEDAITIEGDPDQLQQLLLNLVDNAIKYTPAGGTIMLSLRDADGMALIEVRDTGMGIPAGDLPHIFDRFYRVDKARSRRIGGAGLGLAIVQSIAGAHGGRVTVESPPGQGTTFGIWLPRPARAGGARIAAPVAGSPAPALHRNGYADEPAAAAMVAAASASVVPAGKGPH